MKITNQTRYSTPDLRRFLTLAFRELKLGDADAKRRQVRFAPSRRRMHWGYAYYPHGSQPHPVMMLSLPAPGLLDLAELWQTLRHENAHNLGIRHGEMHDALRYCKTTPDHPAPAWLWGFELGEKPARPAKPKPSRDERLLAKLAHAEAGLREHERKLRREGTLVRKWRKRVAYYRVALLAGAKLAAKEAP